MIILSLISVGLSKDSSGGPALTEASNSLKGVNFLAQHLPEEEKTDAFPGKPQQWIWKPYQWGSFHLSLSHSAILQILTPHNFQAEEEETEK